jgi:hypothetical protein
MTKKIAKRTAKPTKPTLLKRKLLLEALEESLGIISVACRKVGVNRSTFYDWYKTDTEFRDAYDDIANIAKDFVESRLLANIRDGDVASTIFYLKTKGKDRGYSERVEVDATVQTVKRFNLVVQPDEG